MEFSNVITINDIINSVVLLFSSITIILTYLTLKEMKKQRNISILPNIFVKYNQNISYNIKNIKKNNEQFKMEICNNGNSPSKNINCTLKFLNLEGKKFDNVNIVNDVLFYNFKDYIGFSPFNSTKNNFFIQTLQKDISFKVDTKSMEHFIQCISKSIIDLHSENTITSEIIQEWKKLELKLLLRIAYEDIIGNKYNIEFYFSLVPSLIDYKEKTIDYILKLDNIKN